MAVVPLIGVVAATFFVGYALNKVDAHLKLKEGVVSAFKALPAKVTEGIYVINATSKDYQNSLKYDIQTKGSQIHREFIDWLCPICRRY